MTARIVEKAGVAASVASAASADDAGVRARKTAAAVAAAAAPASSERACKDSTVGSSESDDMSHRLKRFQHNAPTANPSPADLTDGYGAALHKTDFHWVGTDEPHASRRKLILAKYPHIRDLYGYDHKTVWITLGLVTLQLTMAYLLRNSSVWFILPFAWAISGSSNSCLNMVVHECAHGLALKYRPYNAVLGMIANIPTCVPSSITFRRYHLDHHTSQGVDGVDVDLPTDLEGKYVRGRFLKALWLFFVPLFYTLRPMFVKPRSPILAENINQAFIITIDVLIYHFWGWRSLFYLFGGLWLGSSYHPSAAHFIAEHFEFAAGAETYSYYGPLNNIMLNVGYHNEHHDFPYVPWTRLHKIREAAPEFYSDLPQCRSWVRCIWDFVFDPKITLYSRVKREARQKQLLAELAAK